MAARLGNKKRVFNDNDGRSIIYKNAYNAAYDKFAAPSPEEKKRRQAKTLGKDHARAGKPKRDFTDGHETTDYIQSYLAGYESVASVPENQQQFKDKYNGSRAGRSAALRGKTIDDFRGKSSDYQEGFKIGYEKIQALSSEEKQAKKEQKSCRKAASKNSPGPDFKGEDNPVYQLEGVPTKKERASLQLPLGTDCMEGYKKEFTSELFNAKQNLSPLPCFPNFSTLGPECSIRYFEGLNPPQEPKADINSMEELGHYLDSLTSQTPNAEILNLLPPQAITPFLSFGAVRDLGIYETIQQAHWKSRLFQPLFFSTPVPLQQPGLTQETSMPAMAGWVNKKLDLL